MPARPRSQQEEVDSPSDPPALDKNDKIALSGAELAKRSAAATDKAFVISDEKHQAEAEARAEGEEEEPSATGAEELQEEASEEEQEAAVPPPRPTTRPPTLPPTRSVPPPTDEQEEEEDDGENVTEAEPVYATEQDQQDAEPESYAQTFDEPGAGEDEAEQSDEDVDDMPPPPPPPRPAGGHQGSLPPTSPAVPTSPPLRAVPASPPTHPAPPPPEIAALERSATSSSQRSTSTFGGAASSVAPTSPRQSVDTQFDPSRMQGGAAMPGSFLAHDLDLDTMQPWWRSQGGVPRAIQGRYDIFVNTTETSNAKGDKIVIEKE